MPARHSALKTGDLDQNWRDSSKVPVLVNVYPLLDQFSVKTALFVGHLGTNHERASHDRDGAGHERVHLQGMARTGTHQYSTRTSISKAKANLRLILLVRQWNLNLRLILRLVLDPV